MKPWPSALPEMKHQSFCPLKTARDIVVPFRPSADQYVPLINEIFGAKTVDEVWLLLKEALRLFSLVELRYGLTRLRHGHSIGDSEDVMFLTSVPDDIYFESGFYRNAPIFKWAVENEGVQSWDSISRSTEGPKGGAQHSSKRKRAGYIMTFPSGNSRLKGSIGIAAPKGMDHEQMDALWAINGSQIQMICNAAHAKILQLPAKTSRAALRPRQREVLEWIADGKTVQDIALLMELSVSAVEKHLRAARDTLDVETTAQAASKALFSNLLFRITPVAAC